MGSLSLVRSEIATHFIWAKGGPEPQQEVDRMTKCQSGIAGSGEWGLKCVCALLERCASRMCSKAPWGAPFVGGFWIRTRWRPCLVCQGWRRTRAGARGSSMPRGVLDE
jgi:hypothetical protein